MNTVMNKRYLIVSFIILILLVIGIPSLRIFPLKLVRNIIGGVESVLENKIIQESKGLKDQDLKYYMLASAYYNKKDYNNAVSYCKNLLEKDPLSEDIKTGALFLLSSSYIRMENYDDAESVAELLIAHDPAKGHFLKGAIYQKTGNIEKARSEIDLALQFNEKTHTLDKIKTEAIRLREQLTKKLNENSK
jgi:tetratricopeptide (TPR) repeat protein